MSDNTPGAREDLLRELALRLVTYPGDPRNDNPQLLVGQLPENLVIPVPLPEKSQVLGTLIHGPENIDIVLDSEHSPDAVLSFYKERMAEMGWNELEMMGPMHGGFMHSRHPGFVHHTTFCKGTDGPGLTLNTIEGKQQGSDVRLHLAFGSELSPCAQVNLRHQRMHGLHGLIPPLIPPPRARQQGGGGSGGGMGNWQTTASLDTDLDLPTIATHYAQQLEKGGWTKSDEGFSGPLAWSTWTFQDEDKQNWNGLFFVLKVPGKQREHALEVRIDWDKKEQRGGWFSSSSSFGTSG